MTPVCVYFRDAQDRVRAACAYETYGGDRVLYATVVLSARDRHDKRIARKILKGRLDRLRAKPDTRCFYKEYDGEPDKQNPVIERLQGPGYLVYPWLLKIGAYHEDTFRSRLNAVRNYVRMLDAKESAR